MKKLVKVFVIIFCLWASTDVSAQTIGLKAGLNFSDRNYTDDGTSYNQDNKLKLGFHAGVTAEFSFSEKFSFETGLLLVQKGSKSVFDASDFQGGVMEYKNVVILNYLEIPLAAKYYFTTEKRFFAFGGPTAAIGLSAKRKYTALENGVETTLTEDFKFGTDPAKANIKFYDFGVMVGLGANIKALEVSLFYDLGLANVSIYQDSGANIKNKNFGLSVGYKLGRE